MLCPKCKHELDGKTLKCEYCGTKIASTCKHCGTINPIRATECATCHAVLLKICQECGSANLPDANSCRKCGTRLNSEQKDANKKTNRLNIEYKPEKVSQQKAKTSILEAIKDADTSVITLCGESGSGKSLILRYVINELKNAKLIWLSGRCSQITQLSPFGYFQDILLNFFNVNNFCSDTLQLKKNSTRFFRQDFPTLSNQEISDLLNLLYPENVDKFESIYQNKSKMFIMMKKVVLTIIEKVKTIFVIDDYEYIDGMSFDFIQELLKDDYVLQRCKFIIVTKDSKPGMGLLSSQNLNPENYKDFSLSNFTENQVISLITQYRDINLNTDFMKNAAKTSDGNPAIIEQIILLYKEASIYNIQNVNYTSLESIIEKRLDILRKINLTAYRFLCAMSVLGVKFYPSLLANFDNLPEEDFEKTIDYLVNKGFITQLNSLTFEFKSYNIWKTIVGSIKNDEMFEEIINRLYEIISVYKQSSLALLGYIVQKLNNNDQSFEIWTMLMKQATYIGDIGLYIITQKQALKLIEHKNSQYYLKIKKNIYTRVGKLLEPIDYNAAFEYLQNAIMALSDEEEYEHIDLLGYLASAAMKMGNYWGVIECADSVLSKLSADMELEIALVKSRKVTPLVKLGNYGQVVNLIDNEVMPVIQMYLSKGKNFPVISSDDLYHLWLDVYFDLAEALTYQGDIRMFDIIKLIFDIIEKNKITDPSILCRAHLSLALANTIKGDINISEKILADMVKEYNLDDISVNLVSKWNFIDLLNKFIKSDYDNLMSELFNVVSFANNINDNFTKNIFKTLLTKILRDKNETSRALEILDEQVAHFAKAKVATGVLLSWYLIAKIRLETKGAQFALDIATKALDIAMSPNINNYYFICLFNRFIGEIYISKHDFESAKVYIEKAIFVAKQFDLQYLLVQDYLLYAKYFQELALPKSSMRPEYIKQALKMYQLAKSVPITVEHTYLVQLLKSELSVFNSFCKLNGIILKKSIN